MPVPTLPTPPNRFVGREDDVKELAELVSVCRSVTLCGTGGIGKTRLALRVAESTGGSFGDGVWLAELADLAEETTLLQRLVSVLGLNVQSGASTYDEVAAALSQGRQLLVLDNCEHLIDACAVLADRLLASCPSLTILATSREPLRIPGETLWRVPPMTLLPSPDNAPSDAELLFLERARAAAPHEEFDRASVQSLCSALDGIPLAIELAAAMTRVLSVSQITERLSDRFALLSGGPRTAPARQQTLLATVEWSDDMLSADARALVRQLTVFRGGWTLDLAEAVCTDVEDLLGSMTELVDKSLILVDGRPGGRTRYRMLDTVRDFARSAMTEEEETRLRIRHLDCMAALSREGGLLVAHGRTGIQRFYVVFEAIIPNLFHAVAFADATGRPRTGLRALTDMQFAILGHGKFEEYLNGLDRMLAHADIEPWLRGRALAIRAMIGAYCGDYAAAAKACAEAIPLSTGPKGRPALSLASLLAGVLEVEGGLTGEEVIARAKADGDLGMRVVAHLVGAQAAQRRGALREAAESYDKMVALIAKDNYWPRAMGIIGLAEVAEARGDLTAALEHYANAKELLFDAEDAIDHRNERIRCLTGLGRVALRTGDRARAATLLRQSLELFRGLGMRAYAWELVAALSLLASREGDHARSVVLAGAADALRERTPTAEGGAEEILDPARKSLGQAEVDRLWREGRLMPWNRVVARALAPSEARVIDFPQPGPGTGQVPRGPLTERESEIAALVARGLSNRRLAEELYISQATAARHVSNILAKLGFSSRAQIASWVAAHQVER
ncbi:ATP-binding protein [Actinocorallia longicatena]|uniref:HTH luxR-type domain-containing protein n=1 Tax=Actinocorallia longicatena TaxID=111803 RepID=A0ABP6Q5F3_9ACTN